jgi:hypothetical protein
MIQSLRQRIQDLLRERRIARLRAELRDATANNHDSLARGYWLLLRDEVLSRSPQQIERMERAGGLS